MTTMTAEQIRDALSRLVRDRRTELQRSVARVADASGDPGLNGSWVHRLENMQVKDYPKRERLEALARGLDLPPATVLRAAANQFYGVGEVWDEASEARAIVDQMVDMSDDDRATLLAMVEAFAQNRRG